MFKQKSENIVVKRKFKVHAVDILFLIKTQKFRVSLLIPIFVLLCRKIIRSVSVAKRISEILRRYNFSFLSTPTCLRPAGSHTHEIYRERHCLIKVLRIILPELSSCIHIPLKTLDIKIFAEFN